MPGVLIVDDEELIRFSFLRGLGKEGIPASFAENGRTAIEKINQNQFDLAVVDLHLGDVNGIEVIRHIKKVSPDTKVFVITAYSSEELKKDLFCEGISCLYEKPFDTQMVIGSIQKHMGNNNAGEMIERRRADRKPFPRAVDFSLSILDDGQIKTLPLKGKGIDISPTGIGISADYPLKPGHMLSFNGEVGGRTGIVKWSVPVSEISCRAGIRFVDAYT